MKQVLVIAAVVFLLFSTAVAQQIDGPKILERSSIGVGFGIPYGVLGSNFDVSLAPKLKATVGFGTTVLAGMGYNFGLKYFFTAPGRTFRPRVSAFYGVNSMVIKDGVSSSPDYYDDPYDSWGKQAHSEKWNSPIEDEGEKFSGLTLGIGAEWMWGKSKSNGLDLDIMLIATTGLDVDKLNQEGFDVSDPGRIKISLGYRHAF